MRRGCTWVWIVLVIFAAAGCSFGGDPADGGTDADAGLDGADGAADGADGPADGGDPGGRTLSASVLLGAGGFFGISGQLLGDAGALGAGAWAIGGHYADLDGIIGGDRQAGRLYLFRRGAPPADISSVAGILEPPDSALQGGFAYALGNPCDPNGDGRLDLPVGNHLWSESAQLSALGRVVVFWADGGGAWSTAGGTVHRLSDGLRARSDVMGQTVLCADVDGDGYDDLVATGQNAGPADTGLVAIFEGSAAGLPEFESRTLTPPLAVSRQYLGSASVWTDLDGDGRADLAVGGWGLIKGELDTGPHTGGVLAWAGGADWSAGPTWRLFPPADDPIMMGATMALAEVGARRLLLVGAPDYGAVRPGVADPDAPGTVLVFELGSADFPDRMVQRMQPPGGLLDVGFGQSFGYVPDYFGPGAGALLVGMPEADAAPDNQWTGAVAVYPLRGDGQTGEPFAAQAGILLAPAPTGGDGFGDLVLPLGDQDGDGLSDFVIGIPSHLEGDIYTGQQTGGLVFYR